MDKRIAETCHARHTCKQHKILCSTGCPLWIDLKYQMELSGIPKRHSKYNIDTLPADAIKIAALKRFDNDPAKGINLLDRVSGGQGLYLYGNTGTGKTTAIAALAVSYILRQSFVNIRTGKRTRQLVQFVNVPDLLDLLKRGFDDPEVAQQGAQTLENLRRVPLAILDDIGAEKPSEWARERLLTLISSRYDDELATFFSSNLTLKELREPLGARIQSRISGMAIPLEYFGADRRTTL